MGFVYLEHALTIYNADALSIHDNFIAECGSCIELRGWGQASKVTDNLIGAGFRGHSIYAENHGGLLITANNIFPRGASSVHLEGVTRSSVTNNRLHSFYPGMVVLTANSSENLVASNHFLRDHEPWTPFLGVDNGLDDLFGLLRISGSNNSVIGNHFSELLDAQSIRPAGATPVIIRLIAGSGNFLSSNHVVALDVDAKSSDSAFEGQVDALLTTEDSQGLVVTAVMVDAAATRNTILDSGRDDQVVVDEAVNAFRPTPSIGTKARRSETSKPESWPRNGTKGTPMRTESRVTRKQVGIRDVAAAAGVSVTTVSHVLNDTPHTRTSDDTRGRVKAAAEKLGYQPNRLARGLRTQASEMVGLITEEIATTPHAGQDHPRSAGRGESPQSHAGDHQLEPEPCCGYRLDRNSGLPRPTSRRSDLRHGLPRRGEPARRDARGAGCTDRRP